VARRWFANSPTTTQNAVVFPMILLFAAIPAALAVVFRTSTLLLMASFVFCALLYALVYARLVHFHWTRPRLRPAQKSTVSRGDGK
jgi:ammonia channel protein AmtB